MGRKTMAVSAAKEKTKTVKKVLNTPSKLRNKGSSAVKKIKVVDRTKSHKPVTKTAAKKIKNIGLFDASRALAASMKPKLELAILSPFRFPIDSERLAAQVARASGTLFAIIGSVLALAQLQLASRAQFSILGSSNLAQTTTTTTTYNCTDTSSPNYNPTYCSSTATSGSIDTKPTPDLVLEGTQPYAGMIPINVYVPSASSVNLHAYYKTGATSVILGAAFKVSDNQWRFYWDTRQYGDGEYRLKVAIMNIYGTYDYVDSKYVMVDNNPLETTTTNTTSTSNTSTTTTTTTSGTSDGSSSTSSGTDSTNTSTATTSNTTTTTTDSASQTSTTTTTSTTSIPPPSVLLAVDQTAPLKGYARIKTFVAGAAQVKIHFAPATTNTFSFLGYATPVSNNEWRFDWDTTKFPNGSYILKAQAIFSASSYPSNIFTTSIYNSLTTTGATTTSQTTATTTSYTVPLQPTISLFLPNMNPFVGDVDIIISTKDASYVEVYAMPVGSLTPHYLGLASKQNTTDWKLRWNTKNTPNGDYRIYARANNPYGRIESDRLTATVKNVIEPVYTPEEQQTITEMQSLGEALEQTVTTNPTQETTTQVPATTFVPEIQPVVLTSPSVVLNNMNIETEQHEQLQKILESYRSKIEGELRDLSLALRSGDEDGVRDAQDRITRIRNEVIDSLPISKERSDIITRIDEHLRLISAELEELMARNEKIIKERIGEAVTKDSDKDGITDYDEINLYGTDPMSADTDRDNFIDGTEIVSGFDPLSSATQASVVYESPQETGIVRDDLLAVEAIHTLENTTEVTDVSEYDTGAIIVGKGLPNSFVTLYIFSTPIIITVKTDDTGSWSYIFDKELDDGEHEMYVGMTDNAGRIVAKSSPFSFVKTAQAFTPVDASAAAVTPESTTPSLFDTHILLAIASISVVALGLILILLGLHVSRREEPVVATA